MKTNHAAIGLHIISAFIAYNIFIYATTLFLSTYPTTWIPYLFIGQPVVNMLIAPLIALILKQKIVISSVVLFFVSMFIVVVFIILLPLKLYFVPLIFVFALEIVMTIVLMVSWNSVRSAFDLIEFKELTPLLAHAARFTRIITGVANILLIKEFGANFLPYTIVFSIIISFPFVFALKPITADKASVYIKEKSPLQYPLLLNLFLFTFFIIMSDTLIEYLFREQLSVSYSESSIGEYLSIFTTVGSLFSIIVSFLLVNPIIKFNLSWLMAALPLYSCLTSALVLFHPSLLTITLLAIGFYVLYNAFTILGRELFFNLLPIDVRRSSQAMISIIPESLAMIMTSIFLLLFPIANNNIFLLVLIFVLNAFLVFFSLNFKKQYRTTLENEVFLKRFNPGKPITLLTANQLKESLTQLTQETSLSSRQIAAKNTLNFVLNGPINDELKAFIRDFLKKEALLIDELYSQLFTANHQYITKEALARIHLAEERYLHWLAAYTHAKEIHGIMPSLLDGTKPERAKGLEYLITILNDHELETLTMQVFMPRTKMSSSLFSIESGNSLINVTSNTHIVNVLRQVSIFKNVSVETLSDIAEVVIEISIPKGSILFNEHDKATGFYIIASGEIDILRGPLIIASLKENDFLGELALFDDQTHSTRAEAKTDVTLLYIEKDIFMRIIYDIPEVLVAIIQRIIGYLRQALGKL